MTNRRKVGDVLWLALQCAKQDRESFIDAYGGDKSEPYVQEALKDLKAFNRLQLRLFGTTKSKMEKKIEETPSISMFDLIKMMREK